MTLEELKKQRDLLNYDIKVLEEKELLLRQGVVSAKINDISYEEVKTILKFMQHDRTSCSDEDPNNGYSYSNNSWRCRKCMLMEIFNGQHGGKFDFSISADIWEV